jgi:hypothetical protein
MVVSIRITFKYYIQLLPGDQGLQPGLHYLRDILFTDEAQSTRDCP